MNRSFIVELEDGVWVASWEGDPGTTTDPCFAELYADQQSATVAIKDARSYRPFVGAKVVEMLEGSMLRLQETTADDEVREWRVAFTRKGAFPDLITDNRYTVESEARARFKKINDETEGSGRLPSHGQYAENVTLSVRTVGPWEECEA